jgi:hypothetical protein
VAAQVRVSRGRRSGDEARELDARRRAQPLITLEHAALLAAFVSGFVLMYTQGIGVGRWRWLDLKLGLVATLLVPLEALHAYIAYVWIARGLRETSSPPFSKDLVRGIGMQEMLVALAIPLLAIALPLLGWLSLRRPF